MIYLAQPFWSDDEGIRKEREATGVLLTQKLLEKGMVVFSPIAYGCALKIVDFEQPRQGWYEFDLSILSKCDSMIVAKMDGWKQSKGVKLEIKFAREHNIPIMYLEPADITAMIGD